MTSQKGERHRNDTRKNTRQHCSDFSALKNPTTYSNTRSSPLLHLENRSDHHVLLVVVEVVHHLFCLLQELFQSVWQRMINSALNEMTLVWKVKNLKRPWGSHGAKNLQARGQGWQQASPSFDPFAYPSWFCHQTHLGGSPRKHLKYGFLPHPDIWHYLKPLPSPTLGYMPRPSYWICSNRPGQIRLHQLQKMYENIELAPNRRSMILVVN